jgi:tRNA U34 5-methylaminomethyl-2-thiouridine-forming methyltransferase MnmC
MNALSNYLQFCLMNPDLIFTADGSPTLYIPEMNEQYHSLNGAVTESNFVYLEKGYSFHKAENPVVFEVGFGTGLNALITAIHAEKTGRPTFYIAIEKYPLDDVFFEKLNYGVFFQERGVELYRLIQQAPWGEVLQINPFFRFLKIKGDITGSEWQLPESCDVIYFDAFGPDKQPEVWSEQIFSRLFSFTSPGGVLVTYSAKGEVRRRMLSAGFKTEKLPGPPGKKEMLRGIK